jgi:hypothetical protein
MVESGEQAMEEQPAEEMPEEETQVVLPETRSAMPVPRFHPIPSKPAFERSEGMMPTPKAQRSIAKPTTTAKAEPQVSEQEMEAALDQAYLEGVSAAMDDVERKLEAKRQAAAKVKLEEKILQQAESVQKQIEEQEKLQQLVMQNERQLRQQQAARMQPEALVAEIAEPQRLAPPSQTVIAQTSVQRPAQTPTPTLPETAAQATAQRPARSATAAAPPAVATARPNPPQSPIVAVRNNSNTNNAAINPVKIPVQIVSEMKTSVVSRMNDVFTPLLGLTRRAQRTAQPPTRQNAVRAEEVAVTPPNLPGRPTVLPMTSNLGLLPEDETDSSVMQAQFTDE